jgi:hypothetical protein
MGEMGELTKSEVGREEDVKVPTYTLGEMTRLSPSSPVAFVDIVSSRRCLGLSKSVFKMLSILMGASVPVDDPAMDVGGYMLGEIGPSNSDRSK